MSFCEGLVAALIHVARDARCVWTHWMHDVDADVYRRLGFAEIASVRRVASSDTHFYAHALAAG